MHTCEHCGKKLATKERYRRHIRTHTGEKPFKCTMCEKRFAENGNLNRQISIYVFQLHHGIFYELSIEDDVRKPFHKCHR
jgi:uncharacterized Zn-finger protein